VRSAADPFGARRRHSRNSLAPLLLVVSAASLLGACASSETDSDAPDGWVTIRGRRVAVEIADTPQKQALGLGERDHLQWGHGMLFPYERPGFRSFWMKGMRFSIDIIWMLDGRIVQIDPNVPFEEGGNGPTLQPRTLIDSVLEVPAGYVTAHGWRTGDRVLIEGVQPSE
jgi:uncharacterized membrane protein (UPF0127 family)